MKKNKVLVMALVVVFLALGLVACSGGGETAAPASEAPASDAASEAPASEAPASDAASEAPASEAPSADGAASEAPAAEGGGSDANVVIGCTLQDMSNEFMVMLDEAMQNIIAQEYPNVEYTCLDGQGQPETQISQIEGFITKDVDVIIISPADANALIPAVQQALDAGIPVICCSSNIDEEIGQIWCGSSNESGGRMLAEYICEAIGGKGNVVLFRGPMGHFAEIGRTTGVEEVLAEYPDVKLIYDQTGNWSREEGMSLMENWLQTGEQIDGVMAENDEMALGALVAIEAAGKLGEIKVCGLDAIKDALDSVKAGVMDATIFQDAVGQAENSVHLAVKAALGEPAETMDIPFELVTIDNVDSYYDRI